MMLDVRENFKKGLSGRNIRRGRFSDDLAVLFSKLVLLNKAQYRTSHSQPHYLLFLVF